MKFKYVLFSVSSLLAVSCKNGNKNSINANTNSNLPTLADTKVSKATAGVTVKLLKADEAFSKEASAQKPFNMITDSLWHFYFALSISQETPKENIYKGHWLDLKDDGSYQKGEYEQITDEGKYIYHYDNKNIELRSTQKDSSSEWNVKVDPDAMLLIGTDRYNNNSWQIKLIRKSVKPKIGVPLRNDKSN
ncbi:MAG: hypothetical protein IT267_03605 [Saprospiraceae bacterium]|nr:hypothetical protein [Saprospiraceae bacterium]